MEHAVVCPQCNAPISPHRFARSIVCSYCGTTIRFEEASVSAETFHSAFRVWNSPASYQISSWVSIGESHWALHKCIASGEISDVYTGQRARWPTELAIIKVLRDARDAAPFDNEWEVIQRLQGSDASGSDTFTTLLPQPIIRGISTGDSYTGRRVSVFRWIPGFYYTFDDVLRVYPQGIPPRASIWIWRRILEVLSFLHKSGMAHGAVLPAHLLLQENEHGVRLVGYSSAGPVGKTLRTMGSRSEAFYPKSARSLTAQLDLAMSARCIVAILGGDPATGALPKAVPTQLAQLVQQLALTHSNDLASQDAWSIREELGVIAGEIFGAPQFIPIVMPS